LFAFILYRHIPSLQISHLIDCLTDITFQNISNIPEVFEILIP
uniref:IS4 family transposase n=1 Tax=Brugia timori TaxID=42155 RepID=A0A0R3QJV6_9BILA